MMRNSRSKWTELVRRWRASDLTAREFATIENLNTSTLRWWASALKREAPRPAFVEIRLPAVSAEGRIDVIVGDVTVRVCGEFDEKAFRRVLSILEAR
jgi:hypothetical protein